MIDESGRVQAESLIGSGNRQLYVARAFTHTVVGLAAVFMSVHALAG
jgi:hypothetical protein